MTVSTVKVAPQCCELAERHIDINTHQQWFDAIQDDDAVKILQIIRQSRAPNDLVAGHFDYGDSVLAMKARCGPCSSVHLPLAVAVVCGATKSISALLEAGVSPQLVDCHGNNVVHSMIVFLHYHADMEEEIISKFQLLVDSVSVDVMREILHHENSFGLRPIEFAAQHGQGSMVLAIMNTPGVYLTKQQVCGITCYKWYNITEYESTGSSSRSSKSPLLLMTYLDNTAAESKSFQAFVEHDIISTWFKKKITTNLPLMVLWALIRFMFVTVFMIFDLDMSTLADEPNITYCIPPDSIQLTTSTRLTMTIYLCVQGIISLCFFAFDLAETFKQSNKPLMKTVSGNKNWLLQTTLYQMSYFSLCVLVFILAPLTYFESSGSLTFWDYTRVICPFLACWSCLYFVQMIPGIGQFIISVYGMMKNLIMLCVLYLIMITPFIQSFYNFMNNNSLQGCIEGFTNLADVIYSLFQIMLNMINLTQYKISNASLLYTTHIGYIFLVAIMLINFFIAVMTETFGKASSHMQAAFTLQRSGVAFSIEMLWGRIIPKYYHYVKRKTFDTEEGEILIIGATTQLKNK